jgi:mRNA deadenylase 3'-5' endonuclease subunit Ccr4
MTNITPSFRGCLDYIWLSAGHWDVKDTLSMPYSEEDGPDPANIKFRSMPNENFPSDHLAIACIIELYSRE